MIAHECGKLTDTEPQWECRPTLPHERFPAVESTRRRDPWTPSTRKIAVLSVENSMATPVTGSVMLANVLVGASPSWHPRMRRSHGSRSSSAVASQRCF